MINEPYISLHREYYQLEENERGKKFSEEKERGKNSQRGNPVSQGYGSCRQKGTKFQINDNGSFIRG